MEMGAVAVKTLLFSTDEAVRLNEEIRRIEPYFYLFMNFHPATECVGEQETFTRTVLNFYRFLQDASILKKLPEALEPWAGPLQICEALATLRRVAADAHALRTYLAHNQCEENGTGGTIGYAEDWLYDAIGKERLDTPDDHRAAAACIEREAGEACAAVRTILAQLGACKQASPQMWGEVREALASSMAGYYFTLAGKTILWSKMVEVYCEEQEVSSGGKRSEMLHNPKNVSEHMAKTWSPWEKKRMQSQKKNDWGKMNEKERKAWGKTLAQLENRPLDAYVKHVVKCLEAGVKQTGDQQITTLLPDGVYEVVERDLRELTTKCPSA